MLFLCSALPVPLILNVRFYFTNPRDMDYKSYSGGCMNACVRARSPHNICCRDARAPTSSARVLYAVVSFVLPMTACCRYMGAFVSSWVCLCSCLRTLPSTCISVFCCAIVLFQADSFTLAQCSRTRRALVTRAGKCAPFNSCNRRSSSLSSLASSFLCWSSASHSEFVMCDLRCWPSHA